MSLSTIAITQGDGGKVLATSAVVQDATTVEVQRYASENYALAGPETYAYAVNPTSPTSGGVLLAIENGGASERNIYIARIELIQTSAASSATARTVKIGRGAANGTGGTTASPISLDPGGAATGATIRTSSNATPDTGITAPTGTDVYSSREFLLGATNSTLASTVWDFGAWGPGRLPAVPYGSTEPITVAISGTAATADFTINVVYIEHGV